ncbi:MAG: TonB-dependent receptor [Deltaproteobacteria bacterium]|nr:TonB-dependent receptor [Deltaproteobacteria bacterium]
MFSNRLVPNRNVIYNIARACEQLKQYPDAYRYYTQTLEQESDPQVRQRIEEALARIGPGVAVLDIVTDPPGATVYLDRRDLGPRGNSPRRLGLSPGRYQVLLALDGYEPAQTDALEVEAGAIRPVRITLKRILGTIRAAGEPAGTQMHVDDENAPAVCAIPCQTSLPPGKHTLYFTRDGFQSVIQTVEVAPRAVLTVRTKLEPLQGTVVVSTDEREALVEIDGRPVGFSPAVLLVHAGSHRVRVSLSGYRSVERQIAVLPNRQVRLDLELRRFEEVSAASRSTESVEDAPGSVTIISQNELRTMAYPNILEAMRGVRGVYVSDDRSYPTLGFRGFSRLGDYGNRVLVLVDGHAMNDNWMGSSYVGYDGRTDLGDIERIEVVRGPGSVLYGTGAFSGVVNLVTRNTGPQSGAEVGVSTGDYGMARARGRVDLRLGKNAGVWMSVGAGRSNGRDYYLPEYADEGGWARHVDGFKSGTVSGKAWWNSLSLQWQLHSHKKRIPNGAYDSLFGDPRTSNADTRAFVEAKFDKEVVRGVQIMTRAFADSYRFHGAYPYAPADGGLMEERYAGAWAGGEGRVVVEPATRAKLTLGGESQLHFLAQQRGRSEDGVYLDRNDPFRMAAAYALADLTPWDSMRMSGGARVDWHSTYGASLNPRVALIFRPYERGILKFLGGKAFRAPSVMELYYGDSGATQVASADVTHLRPETLWSPEVEFSHRFSNTWVGMVAGYANYIDSLITGRGDGTPESLFHYENSLSPVLTVGGEVELRREWHQGWAVSGSYSLQRSQYLQSHNASAPLLREVPNSPEHLAALKGSVPIIPQVLIASTRVSIEGPRYDKHDQEGDPAQGRTDPACVWDVVFSGEAARGTVRYAIGAYNVFDWRYTVPISRETSRQTTILQYGRTFLMSASTHF